MIGITKTRDHSTAMGHKKPYFGRNDRIEDSTIREYGEKGALATIEFQASGWHFGPEWEPDARSLLKRLAFLPEED